MHYDRELWRKRDHLLKWLREADTLVVRNQTAATQDLLAHGARLKVVGRLGLGLDNIDLAAARARDVVVMAAQGANAVAVAEYVFTAMLHVSRSLPVVDATVREGRWDRTLGGFELFGKIRGVIGMGDIAQRIAARTQNFGIKVAAFDP